jgi:rubrerythrin
MIDVSAIPGLLSSLKVLKDMTQATVEMRDIVAFRERLIEIQPKIIDAYDAAIRAQIDRSALLEQIRELEKQVAGFEAWEAEKQRYELVKLHAGALAFRVKESMRGAEPEHYICASCYQEGKKSILQGFTDYLNENSLTCPRCKTKTVHSYTQQGDGNHAQADDYDPFDLRR